jgi:hypothetical protein
MPIGPLKSRPRITGTLAPAVRGSHNAASTMKLPPGSSRRMMIRSALSPGTGCRSIAIDSGAGGMVP